MQKLFKDHFLLRDCLAYDTINVKTLSIGERISVHQFIGQGIDIPEEVAQKLEAVHLKIIAESWLKPRLFYNEAREFQQRSATLE